MTKVFVITKGSYSDYSIVGMFSSRAKAQRALNTLSIYDKNDTIEEYELDELDKLTNKFARGYLIYYVQMLKDGTTISVEPENGIDTWVSKDQRSGKLWGNILAKSKEHAVKIMNEHRAQFIAAGEL